MFSLFVIILTSSSNLIGSFKTLYFLNLTAKSFIGQCPMTKCCYRTLVKPGFHIVVSVVSVLSKKLLRQIQPYGNLTHNRPIRQIQRVLRDRNDSISYNRYNRKWAWHDSILLMETTASDWHDRYNKNVSQNTLCSAAVTATETTDTTNTTIWKPKILNCRMSCVALQGASFTRQKRQIQLYGNQAL